MFTEIFIKIDVFVPCFQLSPMTGIELVPSLSSYFQSEGPGNKHNSSVNRLLENSCQSTMRMKMSLFTTYYLDKLNQAPQVIVNMYMLWFNFLLG